MALLKSIDPEVHFNPTVKRRSSKAPTGSIREKEQYVSLTGRDQAHDTD
jgi:hypothetical protein